MEKDNNLNSCMHWGQNEILSGFPIGRVAQTIRKIISPSFSNHDVESIAVVLVSHLMIEERINDLIIKWLTGHIPEMASKNRQGVPVNEVARDEIEDYINKLDFSKKLKLIKPLGTLLWGDDSEAIFRDFYKINNARVEIAHRLDLKSVKFDNFSLATEVGLEKFLDLAQQRLLNVSDLKELIDG
ncbi:MAG: hypothetical protein A4E66_02268 [Syntrophus sp. PtaB.Bin001]|nr:MAG: hypothetical protein A4E66_02268 [Syntrophus sp. PtaB.Bin001]